MTPYHPPEHPDLISVLHYLQHGEGAQNYLGPAASIDFCEANYHVSPLAAEFFNSWSSLLFMCGFFTLGLIYGNPCREKRVIAIYALGNLVGVGSFLFHGTLRYHMQAIDELPMLYCNLACIFTVFNLHPGRERRWFAGLMVLAVLQTTIYYYMWWLYLVFIFNYAVGVGSALLKTGHLIFYTPHSEKTYSTLKALLAVALVSYYGGLVTWLSEHAFCDQVAFLYLHAWAWHGGASFGVHLWVQMMVILQMDRRGIPWTLQWPVWPLPFPTFVPDRVKEEPKLSPQSTAPSSVSIKSRPRSPVEVLVD